MKKDSMIRLVSPNLKSDELVFYWQQNAKVATEENKYIINTIYWVIFDVDELRNDKDLKVAMDKIDLKSYSSVKELSEIFNRKLTSLKEDWTKGKMTPSFMNRRANKDHLHHIIDYCYGKAVDEPDKLNQYVPFSAEVYGETSFELVDQIIEWVKFKPDDIFIDLGSGVGQVVLQVAATTDCRSCCGIEKADYPTKCALILEQEFRKLMLYFGKPYNHFALVKGDFLGDEYQETISNSTVIFANNFAFGPLVDHQLKNRFTSLKEGAKIISSKAFCPLKFRITDRNLDDIGSIMRVTSLRAMENAVSWTCTAFSYYLHQVDHSMLEDYFAKYKQSRENDDSGNGRAQRVHRQQSSNITGGKCDSSEGVLGAIIEARDDIVGGGGGGRNSMVEEESLTQSLDRSLHIHSQTQMSRRLAKSIDSKNSESAGRRASERLLRHSKKRPLYGGGVSVTGTIFGEDQRDKGAGKRACGVGERSRLRKSVPVTRSQSRSTSTDGGQRSVGVPATPDENRHPMETNKSNIDQLYRSTMDTINGKMSSVNGGPEMTRFAAIFEPRELAGPEEALRYAATVADHVNVGHRECVVPVAVHEYLELVKHRLMRHIGAMHSPAYRTTILSEIDNQMALRDQLSARVLDLESQIPRLHREGVTLLSNHLHRLGIEADSPSTFFSEARKLIRDQARVETDNSRLKKEIGDLLSAQRELRDRIREQEVARDVSRRQQDALVVFRNNQMIELFLQQQAQTHQQQQQAQTHEQGQSAQYYNTHNGGIIMEEGGGSSCMEYTSLYSPISKASSPDTATTHVPSM